MSCPNQHLILLLSPCLHLSMRGRKHVHLHDRYLAIILLMKLEKFTELCVNMLYDLLIPSLDAV